MVTTHFREMLRCTMMHFIFSLAVLTSTPNCAMPALAAQHHDAATIRRLEHAWSVAFLTGDTAFEQCLLLPGFTEIHRNGSITNLADELALAARNRGKPLPTNNIAGVTVIVHGDAAVAYGTSFSGITSKHTTFADYYVWDGGVWRVYFGQQTAY